MCALQILLNLTKTKKLVAMTAAAAATYITILLLIVTMTLFLTCWTLGSTVLGHEHGSTSGTFNFLNSLHIDIKVLFLLILIYPITNTE